MPDIELKLAMDSRDMPKLREGSALRELTFQHISRHPPSQLRMLMEETITSTPANLRRSAKIWSGWRRPIAPP
jgi:hypothetical protein